MKNKEGNFAFIDGQNLYLGTKSEENAWQIDFFKFRKYLRDKYKVTKAYYFLGYVVNENDSLYDKIQEAGFVLKFRKHNSSMLGQKKGNVDADLVFDVMKRLYKQEELNKILLVSGDGDYKMLIDFLIEEERFEKILFPNKKYASSLYRKLEPKYFDYLSNKGVRRKIEYNKKGSP